MISDRIKLYLDSNAGLLAPSTLDAYRERLEQFAKFVGERRVTPLICKSYLSEMLTSGLSRQSASAYYSTIQACFVWLHEAGVITANPVPKLRRFIIPKKERARITHDELKLLLAQARKDNLRGWYFAILAGWETALRLTDVVSLQWREVNQKERVITRTPIKTKRFGKVVEIPISEELIQAMRDCPPYHEGDPSFVCPQLAQDWKFDAHKTVSAAFIRLSLRAGVNKTFHALRHGRINHLLDKGVPTAVVRAITGQSLRVLENYSAPSMEAKRNAVA